MIFLTLVLALNLTSGKFPSSLISSDTSVLSKMFAKAILKTYAKYISNKVGVERQPCFPPLLTGKLSDTIHCTGLCWSFQHGRIWLGNVESKGILSLKVQRQESPGPLAQRLSKIDINWERLQKCNSGYVVRPGGRTSRSKPLPYYPV